MATKSYVRLNEEPGQNRDTTGFRTKEVKMKNLTKLSAIALAGSVMMTSAKAVEIEVGYAYSSLFDVTMERLIPEFNKAHPDITVKFRATYENYEDGTNTILREAVAGDLPDVTFQGLNRQAILVEKGIAKSLEPFIAKEADFAKDGYHQAMLDLGTFNGCLLYTSPSPRD